MLKKAIGNFLLKRKKELAADQAKQAHLQWKANFNKQLKAIHQGNEVRGY